MTILAYNMTVIHYGYQRPFIYLIHFTFSIIAQISRLLYNLLLHDKCAHFENCVSTRSNYHLTYIISISIKREILKLY